MSDRALDHLKTAERDITELTSWMREETTAHGKISAIRMATTYGLIDPVLAGEMIQGLSDETPNARPKGR